jgi:hypothetical protein
MIMASSPRGHIFRGIFLAGFACVTMLFFLVAIFYACLRGWWVQYKAQKDLRIISSTTSTIVDIETSQPNPMCQKN